MLSAIIPADIKLWWRNRRYAKRIRANMKQLAKGPDKIDRIPLNFK